MNDAGFDGLLTFLIPVRIDNADRLENLNSIIEFIESSFPASHVLIVEDAEVSKLDGLKCTHDGVEHIFRKNTSRFCKTETINTGLAAVRTPCVAIYDADVLINPAAIRKSVRILRRGIVKIVIPYNFIVQNISGSLRSLAVQGALDDLDEVRSMNKHKECSESRLSVNNGGMVLFDTQVLLVEGGFNRKMISYGWEDTEILKRLEMMGYPHVVLSEYNLFHLDHARGTDSVANEMYSLNENEFRKVCAMRRKELREYIDSELVVHESVTPEDRMKYRRRHHFVNAVSLQQPRSLINKARVYYQIYGFNKFREELFNRYRSKTSGASS